VSEAPAPRRLPAHAVVGNTALRINPPGIDAVLVNISSTGLLAESPAKLRVGTAVEIQFHDNFTPSTVAGRVVRCEVAIMERDGLLRYYLGIEFDAAIALIEREHQPEATPAPPVVRNRW
jgi:PilZ domain-containing protein